MKIEFTRGSITIIYDELDKETVCGYGEVCIDGKLYIGKSTLIYKRTEVNLSDEEKEKVIEEVKQSEWANLIVFDEY